jgi:hypothetical protein
VTSPLPPVLFDTVTLRHFAACDSLALLEAFHDGHPHPCWTEAVHGEVDYIARTRSGPERKQCRYILSQNWLGEPVEPAADDQLGIMEFWIALNPGDEPPTEHAGEAQSIYLAGRLDAIFATDDAAAYDFAQRRLGVDRVIDTIDILRQAVASALIAPGGAVTVARTMRAAGRHLRRVHAEPITADYFSG